MKTVLLPLAQVELDEAFLWYEEQVVGLGYQFLEEFNQAAKLVESFPDLYEKIDEHLRRCLLNRFPYGLIYGIDKETIRGQVLKYHFFELVPGSKRKLIFQDLTPIFFVPDSLSV